MKLIIFFILLLFTISLSQTIHVPSGSSVSIDGTIGSDEWRGAVQSKFPGGKSLKFKHNDNFLYIAIKGNMGGFASIALLENENIKILHSSTRLITATYVKKENFWLLDQEFQSLPNAKRNEPVIEERQLDQFGWSANLVSQGSPKETELKIKLTKFINSELKISIVFFQFRAQEKYAHMPASLNDGSLDRSLIEGGKVGKLKFDPNSWLTLKVVQKK